jgi:hypothetical protein
LRWLRIEFGDAGCGRAMTTKGTKDHEVKPITNRKLVTREN